MTYVESAVTFTRQGARLQGIVASPLSGCSKGVMVVVGGPQYRAGSHRQFTLLSRDLAAAGIPVFRFDYSGMGDSEGPARTFEEVQDDIRAAVDAFMHSVPSLSEVALWGLCDGASASAFYAATDRRITSLILLNPWVRTEQGIAKTFVKRYYLRRICDPEFWRKIFSGRFNYSAAIRSLSDNLKKLTDYQRRDDRADQQDSASSSSTKPLPERVLDGLTGFSGKVLFILSGDDLTAQEFELMAGSDARWRKYMSRPTVCTKKLAGADHTFSRRAWRDQVSAWTLEWMSCK